MPKECIFTGKRTTFGNNVATSGAAIKKGGFGLHCSGRTKRTFKPNLQKVNLIVDGKPTKAYVSTRAIRDGLVEKPLKRKYGYTRLQKEQGGA
ncbi:MAG: 50S ribosomal protein L28 [Planctomycetota bacterium]